MSRYLYHFLEEAGTEAAAELASGTGSALGASVHVAPRAELAAGTGSALDATVSFASGVFVSAELASGAGTANGGAAYIAARAGVATGAGGEVECDGAFQPDAFQLDALQICEATPEAGLAYNAAAHLAPNAGLAAGTGVALDATGQATTVANAGLATGAGTALAPRIHVAPHLGTTVGTGVAHDVASIWADDNYDATPEGDIPTGYMPPLAAPIDDDDTTITVQYPSTTDPDVPFVVIIDGEQMLVTDVSGTTWTVERGYDDTTATSHGTGTVARPALVRIRVDGVLISADVSYQRSRFTTAANGQPGTAEIWVRDLDRTRSFVTGAEVIVKFRGVRMWGGYIAAIRRQYVFPAGTGNVGDEPRYLILDCVDYNVLFNKRIFFKPGDADRMAVRHWPNGTRDAVVIRDLVNDYLTLGGDDLRYDIQHVGTPALPQISCNPDAPDVFGIGSAGWTWGQVMTAITSQTGAVYYIDPDKTFRYVDDSTKQSRFGWAGLSDTPNNTSRIGYRDVEFTSDGSRLTNDHLQWGAGQGSPEMVFSRVEDEDSIAAHGRWQTGELRFDLYCQDSVDQRAETWVYGSPQNRRGGKDNRFFSRVTVREPYFRVADVLVLQSTEFDFSVTVPVRASEITFPTPWDVTCVLTMAHELDAPWSTFEFWIPIFDFDPDLRIGPGPRLVLPPDLRGPDPWGPLDPCEQVSACVENFSREVEEGWGSWATDSNVIWQTYTGSPTAPSVTGGLGEILGSARMLTLGMAPGLPVEILVKFRHQLTSSNAYNEFGIGDPETSGDVNTLSYDDRGSDHRVLLNHNGTNADFDLPVGWTVDNDEWWWARYRMLSTTQSAGSMWPDSEPEPENWQVQVTGAALDPEYEITVHNSTIGRLGIESIEITEGMCPDASAGAVLGMTGFGVGGNGCSDEFRRTIIGGWGPSELLCSTKSWNASVNGNHLVTGAEARLEAEDEASAPQNWLDLTEWDGNELEFRYRFKVEGEGSAGVLAYKAGSMTDNGPNVGPFGGTALEPSLFLWRVQHALGDNLGVTVTAQTTSDTATDVLGDVRGEWLLASCKVTNTSISMSVWLDGEDEPGSPQAIVSTPGASYLTGLSDYVDTFSFFTPFGNQTTLTVDWIRFASGLECEGCVGDCGDAEPGEFEEPTGDGPEVGDEPGDRLSGTGDNGGVVYQLNAQYQLGSTEVWVDGLRIRLGSDYLEFPRNGKIEILDHIDVGTEEAPATIRVNYIIWTIDDPIPE